MTTTASGLQYEDTVPGSGETARAGQHVTVHYTGWLHDPAAPNGRGRKFDSSKDRNDPFDFPLGGGRVMMWSMQIERSIAVYSDWGAASALGVVLLVMTMGILWLVSRLANIGSFMERT